jgi:hypothetical protein
MASLRWEVCDGPSREILAIGKAYAKPLISAMAQGIATKESEK